MFFLEKIKSPCCEASPKTANWANFDYLYTVWFENISLFQCQEALFFRIINMYLLCEKSVLPGIGILKIILCVGSQNSLNLLFLVMLHNMVILFFLQKHYFTLKRRCSIKMRFVGVINQNCVKILVRVSLYTSMFYVVTRKPCVFLRCFTQSILI